MSDIPEPQLTAYALGELSGNERDAVEALLAKDDDARRFVDEVRATAQALADGRLLRQRISPHSDLFLRAPEPPIRSKNTAILGRFQITRISFSEPSIRSRGPSAWRPG